MENNKFSEWYNLIPKRKQPLWEYNEEKNCVVYSIKPEAEKEIEEYYIGLRGPSSSEPVWVCTFNAAATRIWELCDGIHTVEEILKDIVERYDIPLNKAEQDLTELFEICNKFNLIDLKWRAME